MSGTSATPTKFACSDCGKTLAMDNGIKCRCGKVTPLPTPHFYPSEAISGGSMESAWRRHWAEARLAGCTICGIEPEPVPAPTGSHALASRYTRVPASLDTRGNDYTLPDFGPASPEELTGFRVLVVSADGPELPEIDVPIQYLRDRGAVVKLAGQDWIFQWRTPAAHIVIGQWLADDICVKADVRVSDVNLDEFDAVFIPGGAWNPDMLRGDDTVLKLVRDAHKRGLLIVSLCHGPQVLINAAFDAIEGQENFPAAGIHITGTGSIRRDLKNAGFIVHTDDAVVFDEAANLLTSRDPNDLGAMCLKFGELLRHRRASGQSE